MYQRSMGGGEEKVVSKTQTVLSKISYKNELTDKLYRKLEKILLRRQPTRLRYLNLLMLATYVITLTPIIQLHKNHFDYIVKSIQHENYSSINCYL